MVRVKSGRAPSLARNNSSYSTFTDPECPSYISMRNFLRSLPSDFVHLGIGKFCQRRAYASQVQKTTLPLMSRIVRERTPFQICYFVIQLISVYMIDRITKLISRYKTGAKQAMYRNIFSFILDIEIPILSYARPQYTVFNDSENQLPVLTQKRDEFFTPHYSGTCYFKSIIKSWYCIKRSIHTAIIKHSEQLIKGEW